MIASILSIVLTLALLFLPIFKCEYEFTPEKPVDMTEIEDWDEMGELVVNGSVTKEKSFSLWNDIIIMVNDAILLTDSESNISPDDQPMYWALTLGMNMVLMFIMIIATRALSFSIKDVITANKDLKDIDTATMLMFNEIHKSGTKTKKFAIKVGAVDVASLTIFDVIFTKYIFGIDLSFLEFPKEFQMRNMYSLTGVTFIAFALLGLLIAYFVFSSKKKSAEKDLIVAITQEEYKSIHSPEYE